MDGARAGALARPLPKAPAIHSNWRSKGRRTKAGPDADGNIGIAKLQPAAGEGVTSDHSNPPPPRRAVRRKVVVTPKVNRVPPDKQENLGSIGPLRNWKQIKARIKSGKLNKEPDLIHVRVHDKDGKQIDRWYEVSEPGAATSKSQAQAEQKALARVHGMDLEPGSKATLVRLTVAQVKYEEYAERARAASKQPLPYNEWKGKHYDVAERGGRPGRPGNPAHKADVQRTLEDNPDADQTPRSATACRMQRVSPARRCRFEGDRYPQAADGSVESDHGCMMVHFGLGGPGTGAR